MILDRLLVSARVRVEYNLNEKAFMSSYSTNRENDKYIQGLEYRKDPGFLHFDKPIYRVLLRRERSAASSSLIDMGIIIKKFSKYSVPQVKREIMCELDTYAESKGLNA